MEGKHAILSPSNYSWIRWVDISHEIPSRMVSLNAATLGTHVHEFAKDSILYNLPLRQNDIRDMLRFLYRRMLREIVDLFPLDDIFETTRLYVNDAIAQRMVPEQILYYTENCFGTADSISQLDAVKKTGLLRIYDLKTGETPAKMDQLMIYAALFCLNYHSQFKPGDLTYELRIYQNGESVYFNPRADDILPIMDQIVACDHWISGLMKRNGGK